VNTPNQLADMLVGVADDTDLYAACPSYPDRLREAATMLIFLQEDNARLRGVVRYQEDRDGRIGTHAPLCYSYGRNHYECALQKIAQLRIALEAASNAWGQPEFPSNLVNEALERS
jgi:hypothetical protein